MPAVDTDDAKRRKFQASHFSFNVKGGRCEECSGEGTIVTTLSFMPDVEVTCPTCKGQRYKQETLEVNYRGKNIAQVLGMTVGDLDDEARKKFGIADDVAGVVVSEVAPNSPAGERGIQAGEVITDAPTRKRASANELAVRRTRATLLGAEFRHLLADKPDASVQQVATESVALKARLDELARLAPHLSPKAVLSSNTSGLSAETLAAALPPGLRSRFLITHFFNPPRHMQLLELVAAPDTDPALVRSIGMLGCHPIASRSRDGSP